MEHVSARKEHGERTGGGKRKRETGGLRAVSKVDKERYEQLEGEEKRRGMLDSVAKGIGLCVHGAYPKGRPT